MNVIQRSDAVVVLSDEMKQRRITARFDGCIHIEEYSNGTTWEMPTAEQDRDYMHICDVEKFILQLQLTVVAAKEQFGKHWPKLN